MCATVGGSAVSSSGGRPAAGGVGTAAWPASATSEHQIHGLAVLPSWSRPPLLARGAQSGGKRPEVSRGARWRPRPNYDTGYSGLQGLPTKILAYLRQINSLEHCLAAHHTAGVTASLRSLPPSLSPFRHSFLPSKAAADMGINRLSPRRRSLPDRRSNCARRWPSRWRSLIVPFPSN